jgi:hypothetical protein
MTQKRDNCTVLWEGGRDVKKRNRKKKVRVRV